MTIIKDGEHRLLWRKVRVCTGRREGKLGITEVRMTPVDRKPGTKEHWTDWVEEPRVEKFGEPVASDYVPEARRSAVDVAVEKARKQKPMTNERRLANRITSTRYKMKHPEKSRRESWTPAELREMQETIDTTVEELRLLKEASA